MTIETGVSAILCAAHRDPLSGSIHGHTWTITAWTDGKVYRDGRMLKRRLETALSAWDHATLPDGLDSGEAIASAVASLLGDCTEVTVERKAEGYYARWRP